MKKFVVASPIQQKLVEQIIIPQIISGFWKNARPFNHAESWQQVIVCIGHDLGAHGFKLPRKYNLLNYGFLDSIDDKMLEVAQTINPNITKKQVKKQIISLNHILGSRLKEIGGKINKPQSNRKTVVPTVPKPNVKRVAATFADGVL